ncbi:hypothetical protein MOOR_21470 [Moorella thermoacetica]|uniref:Uncharacterized protein n=1 Tax=Neomoorella thermoacetica TaxID=1525 RepID=A0A1J5JGJ3_NEOTH|nr:hypothetical protein MOOR_21470 [Moorella thermoacetica]
MASWTVLISWYSSTSTSANRCRSSRATSEGCSRPGPAPSSRSTRRQRCSRSLKSIRLRRPFASRRAASKRRTRPTRVVTSSPDRSSSARTAASSRQRSSFKAYRRSLAWFLSLPALSFRTGSTSSPRAALSRPKWTAASLAFSSSQGRSPTSSRSRVTCSFSFSRFSR